MFLWEKVALFRNGDASVVTMSPDQHLNHIGDAAVVSVGGLTDRFLDARVNTQVERGYLGLGHGIAKGWCNANMTRM